MLLHFGRADGSIASESEWDRSSREGDEEPREERENRRGRSRRRKRIARAAGEAAEDWLHRAAAATRRRKEQEGDRVEDELEDDLEVDEPPYPLTPLQRPRGLGVPDDHRSALPPRRPDLVFRAGIFKTIGRLLLWIRGVLRFVLGIWWDKLRSRDSEERRASRLRETFEAMGTTFIKFGQQLSMRLDLIPYAYTRELAKMLDSVPPFPANEAIAAVERATGRPLEDTFRAFDPTPIGSASVACVYQAVLRSGERVAVKVRRPGIGELMVADMRALGWLMVLLEMVALRPGFTGNFLYELSVMLMEELDFVREARFTDLFRTRIQKIRQFRFCTSPRVYFEYSTNEVLVTEFVRGIWLTEILTAVESEDANLQARLDGMNIDRKVLARRILLISRYGNFENIFFHADLHPANILIKPGNKIVLIDFGSCGSFTKRELIAWRRMFDAQSLDDVGGMVQAGLGVIEPLPPIDKDQFALRLEYVFWNDLYAIKSKKSEWWERISARLWIGFLKLAREFDIPMRLNTLRMIRAIMLADTIAARLDHDLDPYKEYRFYQKGAGKRAARRTKKRVRRLLGPSKFTRIEQGIESSLTAIYRIQRALHSIAYIRILPLIGKAALAFFIALRTFCILGIGASAVTLYLLFRHYPDETFVQILWHRVLPDGYFQLVGLAVILPALRRIFYRITDPEYDRRR